VSLDAYIITPRKAYERPAANPDQSPVLIRADGAVPILAPGGTLRISKAALINPRTTPIRILVPSRIS